MKAEQVLRIVEKIISDSHCLGCPASTAKCTIDCIAGHWYANAMRFCLGMVTLAASICLGFGAYVCLVGHNFARGFGGTGDKAELLGITLPYPIMMTLLVVLCLLSAFAAIYALFFPTQSSTEN